MVEQNYAEPVSPDKAIYNGAIPGMLRVLDPHSNFFDPKSYAACCAKSSAASITAWACRSVPRNNKVIVIAPFAGAPAYRAGIRPGDVIIAVDGKPTDNMSTSDVAELLKGPKGTTVKITVLREGTDKPLDFTVVRDEIPRYSVDVHFMIRRASATCTSPDSRRPPSTKSRKLSMRWVDLKGLILDLRQNPGGLLSEGVGVADKFLKKGQVIVSHHGRASAGEGLQSSARQWRQGLSAGRAGQSRHRFGGGDCCRRHSGSRSRPDRRRNHLRQGTGADGLSAVGEHRPGADHGASTTRPADA